MRSRTKIVTVLAAGLLTVGATAPAYAAVEDGAPDTSSASTERVATHGQDGMPDMGRMHEQMMNGMSETASMEDMMQSVPGMAKMHEQMMADHPADKSPSADARENRGE
ncbi:hypothetical protein [Cryobacterium sp. TMS1-13-1]|uniref:hypothetical protein n=1 Tax=Cryobacterium sp. TMS1-13-1 TaxID=1259220 RepID=UPI0010691B82|nr:hypothetical protein [Cryobacterium sp. TMS1-13-1]TFD21513.1 hypothetical protein E3T31_12030 [Cryobacterium sp. TMS1-13-1]